MNSFHVTLGHAHLKVRDLERSVAFYTEFLGLRLTERVGSQFAFLSGGDLHHDLALQALGTAAPGTPRHAVGLFHLAFEVPDRESFAAAYHALDAGGVPVAAVDHGISWAMYFADPDGNGLEIYWDTRHEPHGAETWSGRSDLLNAQRIDGVAAPTVAHLSVNPSLTRDAGESAPGWRETRA